MRSIAKTGTFIVTASMLAGAASWAQPVLPRCTSCADCGPSRYAVAGDVPDADGRLPMRTVRVVVHDLRRLGEPERVSKEFLDETVTMINEAYAKSRLQFVLCRVEVTTDRELAELAWDIPNEEVCDPSRVQDAYFMSLTNKFPNAINVLYVPWMGSENGEASFPSGMECDRRNGCQLIVMAKDRAPVTDINLPGYVELSYSPFSRDSATGRLNGWSTLAHEIGHFFGLYHTFHGEDRSAMCGTRDTCDGREVAPSPGDRPPTGPWISPNGCCAGDFICDTPADREWTGAIAFSCGQPGAFAQVRPIPENLMGSWSPKCRTSLTGTQLARVRWFALTQRPELIGSCPVMLRADFNADGRLAMSDVYGFLDAYFAHSPGADVDSDGAITTSDLLAMVQIILSPPSGELNDSGRRPRGSHPQSGASK